MLNNELELKYLDVTTLYDLAEELVDTVESEYVKDPGAQLALVEPLVEQVSEAADVLSEEFLIIADKGQQANRSRRGRIEGALRRIYVAIDDYQARVKKTAGGASKALRNIADPIVEKIKRQVEVIIATFIDFVEISLDRIMHKTQIDELRQRQEKIALMLHNAGLAAGQQ